MLDLEFVERTDVGRVRDHNEDYLGYASPATPAQVRTHGWLFVLADGVGGHEKGEVASQDRGRKHGRRIPRRQGRGIALRGAATAGAAGQYIAFLRPP